MKQSLFLTLRSLVSHGGQFRSRPAGPGYAPGQGRPGSLYKGRFPTGARFFPYLADFQCRARARAARPGQSCRAGPARPGSLYKGRFPTGDRFPVLSRFSMSCARGQARPAWLGWAGQPSQAWLPLQRVGSYRTSPPPSPWVHGFTGLRLYTGSHRITMGILVYIGLHGLHC